METPELMQTLEAIQAEAARAVDMLLVAKQSGVTEISGISALRKIEVLAKDRLVPDSAYFEQAMTGTG